MDRDEVIRVLADLYPTLDRLADDIRLVGTASSLLRGIDLPVGDVDILARERAVVDDLASVALAAGGRCESPPTLQHSPVFDQYYAEFETAGGVVQFSTIEVKPGNPVAVGECIVPWPWGHFDVVEVGGHRVPLVASELRLLTEVVRGRPERWEPIGRFLARTGYDKDLFAVAQASLPRAKRATMRDAVRARLE